MRRSTYFRIIGAIDIIALVLCIISFFIFFAVSFDKLDTLQITLFIFAFVALLFFGPASALLFFTVATLFDDYIENNTETDEVEIGDQYAYLKENYLVVDENITIPKGYEVDIMVIEDDVASCCTEINDKLIKFGCKKELLSKKRIK